MRNRLSSSLLEAPDEHDDPLRVRPLLTDTPVAPYLLEWVWYHYLLGFQHFHLYDNDSEDNARALLAPLVSYGLVTLVHWPSTDGFTSQSTQQADCFNTSAPSKAEWLTNHDVDEFPVVLSAEPRLEHFGEIAIPFPLHQMLDNYRAQNAGAVVVDRLSFGTSGHATRPAELSMRAYTERDVLRWSSEAGRDWMYARWPITGKVFMRMDAQLPGPGNHPTHDAKVLPSFRVVTAWGDDWEAAREKGGVWEPLRLNHYATRSYAECVHKLDPKNNRQSKQTDWRSKVGVVLCDQRHPGKPSYEQRSNGRNYDLAASAFPDVVERLIALTPTLG